MKLIDEMARAIGIETERQREPGTPPMALTPLAQTALAVVVRALKEPDEGVTVCVRDAVKEGWTLYESNRGSAGHILRALATYLEERG